MEKEEDIGNGRGRKEMGRGTRRPISKGRKWVGIGEMRQRKGDRMGRREEGREGGVLPIEYRSRAHGTV